MLTEFPPPIITRIFSFFNVTFVTFIKQPYIQRIASDKMVTKVTLFILFPLLNIPFLGCCVCELARQDLSAVVRIDADCQD
jgi:hypothetical protein